MTIREIGENLEQYFLDLLKEKRHGFGDRIVMGLPTVLETAILPLNYAPKLRGKVEPYLSDYILG